MEEMYNSICEECGDMIGCRTSVYVKGKFLHYECDAKRQAEKEKEVRESFSRRQKRKRS